MDEPKNRMAKQETRKRGRPRKKYSEPKVLETKPAVIQCNRCGKRQDAKVKKHTPDGRKLHWCSGCGDWIQIG